MIYTLTLNPCLDYTVRLNDWKPYEINRSTDESVYAGGKGINVSVVLSNLGTENTALGFSGGFTGAEIERLLREKGVKTAFTPIKGRSRINVKIMSGKETQFNAGGPDIEEGAVEALYAKLNELKKGDYLVMAGSIPASMPSDAYEQIICRLKDRGVLFVVDTTGKHLTATLPYKPFLIKPNHLELADLFGVEINSTEDVFLYGEKLRQMGARNVIVSMGGGGAVLIGEGGEKMFLNAPKGKVVDTVGAGDSLVAGFLSEYAAYQDPIRAFMRGVATGSATAFSPELATKAESDALFAQLRMR